MVICMRCRRNGEKILPHDPAAKIVAYPEKDVEMVLQENGGDILVRLDNGDPAEYWDTVTIDGADILSTKFRDAMVAKDMNLKAPKR